jgi:hypothetical protein
MQILKIAALQWAFLAIASRLVGAAFRVLETYNPNLRQQQTLSDSKTIIKREATAISLAWLFALGSNLILQPLVTRQKMGRYLAFSVQRCLEPLLLNLSADWSPILKEPVSSARLTRPDSTPGQPVQFRICHSPMGNSPKGNYPGIISPENFFASRLSGGCYKFAEASVSKGIHFSEE